ncbi:MAG: glycosyltransferase [Desulfobacteraceae bacterium]|nr:glycosyltransferase [Desulfobacteraceae bacterium]
MDDRKKRIQTCNLNKTFAKDEGQPEKENLPLVSCIMPTADRPRFVPGAIGCFLRQSYLNKELIIVDDGEKSVEHLIPKDSGIHYIRLTKKHTIGVKRNIACGQARGEIIAHFDDDDWSAPWRLDYQVHHLSRKTADICGLARVYFFDPERVAAWEYCYPVHHRPWIAGGSFAYTKAFWEGHSFRDKNIGEDAWFMWDHPVPRLLTLLNNWFFVACVHSGNTSPKRTGSDLWVQVPVSTIITIMGNIWHLEDGVIQALPDLVSGEPDSFKSPKKALQKTNPLVAVSIPYFGCRAFLRRAVTSILVQTYSNLVLVVVNDGDKAPWEVLADIDDPRLHLFDLPRNHGRYFADALVLNAVEADYFLIQDADDWSEPDRVAVLVDEIQKTDALGVISPNWVHRGEANTGLVEQPRNLGKPLTPMLEHRFNHFGLFSRDWLLAIGGYYGGFSIGYDTLLMAFLGMVGTIVCTDRPLYHRTMRKESLTSAPATGHRSKKRARVRQCLQQLYGEAFGYYQLHCRGEIDREKLCQKISAICTGQILSEQKTQLKAASGQLHQLMTRQVISKESGPAQTFILDEKLLAANPGWVMDRPSMDALRERLISLKPKKILEVGSGISTLVLADYCVRHGATLTSLEHDSAHYRHTCGMLQKFGLDHVVDLTLAPIKQFDFPNGGSYHWYDLVPDKKFDYVLVDGPPMKYGREAAFFWVQPHLSSSWELFLHDGLRDHEANCVKLWQKHFPNLVVELDPVGKGYFKVSGSWEAGSLSNRKDFSRIGITLLTGGRPDLLKRTVDSLQDSWGQLLKLSKVCVLINGKDSESSAYVRSLPFVDRILENTREVLSIGTATSMLMEEITRFNDIDTILHLEDDWGFTSSDPEWLFRGLNILKHHPGVGQIRLRHCDEKVLPYHMITRKPIVWQQQCGFRVAKSAHFTFNPFLMRVVDLPEIFPCASEEEAQKKFLITGMATVQLVKGVFCHLGDQNSLRSKLGR